MMKIAAHPTELLGRSPYFTPDKFTWKQWVMAAINAAIIIWLLLALGTFHAALDPVNTVDSFRRHNA